MRTVSTVLLAVALSCLMVVGCDRREPDSGSAEQPDSAAFDLNKLKILIEGKNEQFTRAHVTGDRATIDGMFTDDAKVLPPNADPVIGRAAIDQLTAQYLEYGITEFREETTDFYGNGQILIDQGNYVMAYGVDGTVEKGKYLNVWKYVQGDWKIYSNIWSANAPESSAD